jgi:hypothetical protein
LNAISPSIIPKNETQRMAAVRRYDILDTPPDGAFDRITAIAARRFDVGVLVIVVVGAICFWAIDKFANDRRLVLSCW